MYKKLTYLCYKYTIAQYCSCLTASSHNYEISYVQKSCQETAILQKCDSTILYLLGSIISLLQNTFIL